MFVERRGVGNFAIGNVANDCNSSDHFAVFIVSR